MNTYEVCLVPILAAVPGGVDLIEPINTITVKACNMAILPGGDGDFLILRDKANSTVFMADMKDVRYCQLKESIKGLNSVAVSSIMSNDAALTGDNK